MIQIKTSLIALIFLLILTPSIHAQSRGSTFGNNWRQRAEKRESQRWTLQDWLAQKERMALMDQWLMMNSPSVFEFYILGSSHSYKLKTPDSESKSYNSSLVALGAYAQSVGLTLEYENNQEEKFNDLAGQLNIRVLGNSLQTTSLTLHIGQRTRQVHVIEQETFRNLFGQATAQIYLTRHFGLQGFYRHYQPESHENLGKIGGSLIEVGPFLDFKGLRLFGNWFNDTQTYELNHIEIDTKRSGVKTGLQIFF